MSLRLFGGADAFAAALGESSGSLYSICNRASLDPADLLNLERRAAEHGHRDLLELRAVRGDAVREVAQFFRKAARLDPQWHFAYSSKVVLSVPDYQDLQKIFLLRCHFAADPGADVLLLVPDRRLRNLFRAVLGAGPAPRELALPGAHAWGRFARTLLRAVTNRASHERARVLVFSLSSGPPPASGDSYFGNFARIVSRGAATLSVYLASGPAVRLPRDAARVPFEAFLSARDVIGTWCRTYASGGVAASAGSSSLAGDALAPLHRYLRAGEVRSGEYFMQRLLARGFRSMVERVAPEVLVYPFENRTWEKHLLAAAASRGVRRVAYQHSSITPRHLAFHIEDSEIAAEHLPDRILTIGEHTTEVLQALAPVLAARVVAGVSLRTARAAVGDAPGPAVLVAISSSSSEALRLLQVTHAAAHAVAVPFIVRTHPTIPIDAMFALFRWPAHVELSVGRSLADDLSRVTLVAYSSSTVALEGMLYGRLPIFVDIGDLPDGDPITGDYAFKLGASDGQSLAEAVGRISRLEPAELRRLREEARAFAERYLCAPAVEGVERMAMAVLAA